MRNEIEIEQAQALKRIQGLFTLNAVLWIVFGLISLVSGPREENSAPIILFVLMVANGVVLLVSGWLLGKRRKVFGFIAVGVVLFNLALTITDQFGALDAVVLGVNVAILVLMFITRKSLFRG